MQVAACAREHFWLGMMKKLLNGDFTSKWCAAVSYTDAHYPSCSLLTRLSMATPDTEAAGPSLANIHRCSRRPPFAEVGIET